MFLIVTTRERIVPLTILSRIGSIRREVGLSQRLYTKSLQLQVTTTAITDSVPPQPFHLNVSHFIGISSREIISIGCWIETLKAATNFPSLTLAGTRRGERARSRSRIARHSTEITYSIFSFRSSTRTFTRHRAIPEGKRMIHGLAGWIHEPIYEIWGNLACVTDIQCSRHHVPNDCTYSR
jgi:hypothetical protein